MSLSQFLSVLRRRFRLVVAILALCMIGGGVVTLLTPRTYTATAELYYSVNTAASVDDLAQGATFMRVQMVSFASLAVTPTVLTPVAERLDVAGGAAALARQVTATASDTTVVLTLLVTDGDARRAAEIANAVADQTITVVEDLSPADPVGGGPSVQVSVVTPALVPQAPSSPDATLNLAAAAVLGLAFGVLAALGREALDTRVRDAGVLSEVTALPLIGTVGAWAEGTDRLVVTAEPHGTSAEGFRQLRTNLQFLRVADEGSIGAHVIAVTSSLAGEGKSTVTSNLACALAETGAAVLLVDADLRRPAVAGLLGLEGSVGLTTVLAGQAEVEEVVQEWGRSGLSVLPSGSVPPNPGELLGSPAMRRLLAELRARYDYVVIDTPPLLPVADAAIVSSLVDGTVVVAHAGRVRRAQLAQALSNLERVSAPVSGLVLNRVRRDEEAYTYDNREGGTASAGASKGAGASVRERVG